MDTIKQDYLKADEFDDHSMREAMKTLKTDYLGGKENNRVERERLELLAYDEIMKSPYKNDYQVLFPKIDDQLRAPNSHPYYFVHFPPNVGRSDIAGTTFLVVINRVRERAEYADVFILPGGDPYYKYSQVLRGLGK